MVVSNIFYVHPYLGKIPILTNIFRRGWNHHLDSDGLINRAKSRVFLMVFVYSLGLNDCFFLVGWVSLCPIFRSWWTLIAHFSSALGSKQNGLGKTSFGEKSRWTCSWERKLGVIMPYLGRKLERFHSRSNRSNRVGRWSTMAKSSPNSRLERAQGSSMSVVLS